MPIKRGAQAVDEHQAQNLFALCAERDADADFAGALRDEIGQHAIETGGRQHQRDDGKGEDQDGIKVRSRWWICRWPDAASSRRRRAGRHRAG